MTSCNAQKQITVRNQNPRWFSRNCSRCFCFE